MTEHDARRPSMEAYLDRLASASPTPGGGSAAALAAAAGASLVEMLARLTAAHPKHADHRGLMEAVVEQAKEVRGRLLDLAARDAEAFDAVRAAHRLPRGTEAEKAARQAAVQEALKGAVEVPLRIMEQCAEVIGLAKNVVDRGLVSAASDGATGAELARAALRASSYNVKTNLTGVADAAYVRVARTRMDEMLYMGTSVATVIDSHVNDLWKSDPGPQG